MNFRQTKKQVLRIRVLSMLFSPAFLFSCGNMDGNVDLSLDSMTFPVADSDGVQFTDETPSDSSAAESEPDILDCRAVPWGKSCKVGNQIYNLAFNGIDAETRREEDVSFEDLHCMGYKSAVIVAGDAQCTACPAWYSQVGARIDDIHKASSVLIAVSTDEFGRLDLSNRAALEETKTMQPDFATGSNPFAYPCRYEFTPYTMVVDLGSATILDMDSTVHKLSIDSVLQLVRGVAGASAVD